MARIISFFITVFLLLPTAQAGFKSIHWSEKPLTEVDQTAYQSMPDADQRSFQMKRFMFLKATESALMKVNWTLGMGSLVGEKLVFIKDKVKEAVTGQDKVEQAVFDNMQETFRQRSLRIVGNILKSIDKNLWEKAPVISKSNEFGLSVAAGIQALGGVGTKGYGGILDLGMSFGYHTETRSLVFQIFLDREKFKSTLMKAVFIAGVVGKGGVYIANQSDSTKAPSRKGESFYPPMIPGFQSTTPELVNFGGSSGLTWPPSPLGDVLTYTTDLSNDAILRITVSPIMKGFVRVSTALNPMQLIVEKISALVEKFSRSQPAPLCSRMLLGL